jgi:hypothetical protein
MERVFGCVLGAFGYEPAPLRRIQPESAEFKDHEEG